MFTGVGTARGFNCCKSWWSQTAIIAYGVTGSGVTNISNLVNSSGVVASDTTGVGTSRRNGTTGLDKL